MQPPQSSTSDGASALILWAGEPHGDEAAAAEDERSGRGAPPRVDDALLALMAEAARKVRAEITSFLAKPPPPLPAPVEKPAAAARRRTPPPPAPSQRMDDSTEEKDSQQQQEILAFIEESWNDENRRLRFYNEVDELLYRRTGSSNVDVSELPYEVLVEMKRIIEDCTRTPGPKTKKSAVVPEEDDDASSSGVPSSSDSTTESKPPVRGRGRGGGAGAKRKRQPDDTPSPVPARKKPAPRTKSATPPPPARRKTGGRGGRAGNAAAAAAAAAADPFVLWLDFLRDVATGGSAYSAVRSARQTFVNLANNAASLDTRTAHRTFSDFMDRLKTHRKAPNAAVPIEALGLHLCEDFGSVAGVRKHFPADIEKLCQKYMTKQA